jgi:carbonic anhydrase
MDFRFREKLDAFLVDEGLDRDGVDVIRVAGSCYSLARPREPGDREFLLRQLEISARLHGIRQIYLVHHEDCGAYGDEDVTDDADEVTMHARDLVSVRRLLEERFPGLEILTYFLPLDGRAHPIG